MKVHAQHHTIMDSPMDATEIGMSSRVGAVLRVGAGTGTCDGNVVGRCVGCSEGMEDGR